VKLGKTWKKLEKHGKNWKNLEKTGKTWKNWKKLEKPGKPSFARVSPEFRPSFAPNWVKLGEIG